MADKIFPKGIYAKPPHEKVKAWTATIISIKVADAIPWLEENKNAGGYVNLLVKINEKGHYVEKDTWEPKKQETEKKDIGDVTF